MIGDGNYEKTENILLKAQRDELLAAAKDFFRIWDDYAAGLDDVSEAVKQLKTAVAKSEGRAS